MGNFLSCAMRILDQVEAILLTFVAHIPIHHLHRNCHEIIILNRYTPHFIIEIQTKRSLLLLSFAASILTNFLEGQSDAQTMGFPYPTFGKMITFFKMMS